MAFQAAHSPGEKQYPPLRVYLPGQGNRVVHIKDRHKSQDRTRSWDSRTTASSRSSSHHIKPLRTCKRLHFRKTAVWGSCQGTAPWGPEGDGPGPPAALCSLSNDGNSAGQRHSLRKAPKARKLAVRRNSLILSGARLHLSWGHWGSFGTPSQATAVSQALGKK